MKTATTLLVLASLALFCTPAVLRAQGSDPSTTPPTPIPTATATPTTTATATVTPTPTPPTTPPSPTLTMDQAVQQAQTQLPPPPPIYDLTDAGIVYGTLAEGVNAWIATLGGNRDQFGNLVTGTYVGAVRPDVVPASLQTFLLQYYAGDPTIGLAFGPEGVTEATLSTQAAYNGQVSQLAQSLYDSSVQAANNSENVPPLDNNDNGNGNANNTNGNGNSTPPPTTGPATVEAIEADFGVDLQRGDKDFTEGELAAVRVGLSALPQSFYGPRSLNPPETENPAPLRIQRFASITHNGQQAFGLFSTGEPAHVEISDAAWNMWEYDFPAPPFDEASGREAEFGGTLVHETVHRHLSTDAQGNYLGDLADKPAVSQWASQFGWQASGGGWTCSQTNACVTQYAAEVNPEEDICESVMMYVFWPNRLKYVSQAKYDFVKNVLGVAESGRTAPYPPQ